MMSKQKTCEWKSRARNHGVDGYDWVTSCEIRTLVKPRGYKFCPFCGKKIVEVDDE